MDLLIGKAEGFAAEQEQALLRRVREHLLDLADSRKSLESAQHIRSAAVLLDRQSAAMCAALRQSLARALRQALPQGDASSGVSEQPARDIDGLTLSLIDVDEVNRLLLLDRVAQPFNLRYETALTSLSRKLAALMRRPHLPLSENPFRPAIFIGSFMSAWEDGDFDREAHDDLMGSLDVDHFLDLAPLYAGLLALLDEAGVQAQPQTPRIRKAPDSSAAPLSAASPPSASVPLDSRAGPVAHTQGEGSTWGALVPASRAIAQQARAFLQRMGWARPQAGDTADAPAMTGAASAPVRPQAAADPRLMDYLTRIQAEHPPAAAQSPEDEETTPHAHTNVLRQLREREEIQRAPELDRGTVDVLAEVFDYVFADQAIPVQMKMVIGRLQIPVLKAAMMDRDFFLSGDHPARKLVDTLATASVAWAPEKGENDPLYVRIETTVQRVLSEFEDDLTVFRELLAEFMEFLFETEQQAEARIQPAARQEQDQEALAQAQAQADEVIHARLKALSEPLAPFLTPFLTNQWRDVIARSDVHEHEVPGGRTAALQTMDQLIWSVQPKTSAEDRRQLVQVLPELVRQINAGLDALGWDGNPRAKFTRRMIATHMQAIRMKAPEAEGTDTQNAALEEQDASAQAMQALDQRRARKLAGYEDAYDQMAQEMSRGLWFEMQEPGQTAHRCRLSWISPMRTRFLFTNREGYDAFVRSEREVASMLRRGHLQALEQAPIVARALDQLMAEPADAL
jgi:hypothetical protein